jgi:hypothetical protein
MKITNEKFPDFIITDGISEEDQAYWPEGYHLHVERITEVDTQSNKEILEMSIEKWKFILWAMDELPGRFIDDWGWASCPCCAKYYDRDNESDCHDCPIGDWTGETLCAGTPYDDYQCSEPFGGGSAARTAAAGMVDLLQRILDFKNWNEAHAAG